MYYLNILHYIYQNLQEKILKFQIVKMKFQFDYLKFQSQNKI
jgi:hypothetical protein